MFSRRSSFALTPGIHGHGEFGKLLSQFWLELNSPGVLPARLHEIIHILMAFCLCMPDGDAPPPMLPAHPPASQLEELTDICWLAMAGEENAAERLRGWVYRHFRGYLAPLADNSGSGTGG